MNREREPGTARHDPADLEAAPAEDPFVADAREAPAQRRDSRLRSVLAVGALLAFVTALALSTVRGQLPTGAQGGRVRDDRIRLELTSITGESIPIPGNRPGALLFMTNSGCANCPALTRTLSRLAQSARSSPRVTVVSLDSVDSRSDFDRFADAAGNPEVDYSLDDRSGTLNGVFGIRELGTIVVYDRTGTVLDELTPGAPRLTDRLRRLLREAGA